MKNNNNNLTVDQKLFVDQLQPPVLWFSSQSALHKPSGKKKVEEKVLENEKQPNMKSNILKCLLQPPPSKVYAILSVFGALFDSE